MIQTAPSLTGTALPLVFVPDVNGDDLTAQLTTWVEENHDTLFEQLYENGAILFRDFGFKTKDQFGAFAKMCGKDLLAYVGGASQRHKVQESVYTSTDASKHLDINQHNESAYQSQMPRLVLFYCHKKSKTGGQTPLSDSRAVYRRLPAALCENFATRRVEYLNNMNNGFGIGKSWQSQFESDDPAIVEAYLTKNGYEYAWTDHGLRTRLKCDVIKPHPVTGELCWVGQPHHWHPSNLVPGVRQKMEKRFAPEEMPLNVFFADGGMITEVDIKPLQEAIDAETVQFDWEEGDVLLIDNYLAAHGRRPYEGEREVYVSLA